jgi:DNA ligase-1
VRGLSWLKLKRDYLEGLADSLDLVPIGAWHGQGRKVRACVQYLPCGAGDAVRCMAPAALAQPPASPACWPPRARTSLSRAPPAQVQWFSPFLCAVYDREREQFQSLCRVMSGFSDEFYAAATARLGATAIPAPKPYYATGERPSVWFEPTEVWEVRGAELSISPVHKAAVGRCHQSRGISLRFPRWGRWWAAARAEHPAAGEHAAGLGAPPPSSVPLAHCHLPLATHTHTHARTHRFLRLRPDKAPEDASGPGLVEELYNRQARRISHQPAS